MYENKNESNCSLGFVDYSMNEYLDCSTRRIYLLTVSSCLLLSFHSFGQSIIIYIRTKFYDQSL